MWKLSSGAEAVFRANRTCGVVPVYMHDEEVSRGCSIVQTVSLQAAWSRLSVPGPGVRQLICIAGGESEAQVTRPTTMLSGRTQGRRPAVRANSARAGSDENG
jgi:hypothetical protein